MPEVELIKGHGFTIKGRDPRRNTMVDLYVWDKIGQKVFVLDRMMIDRDLQIGIRNGFLKVVQEEKTSGSTTTQKKKSKTKEVSMSG